MQVMVKGIHSRCLQDSDRVIQPVINTLAMAARSYNTGRYPAFSRKAFLPALYRPALCRRPIQVLGFWRPLPMQLFWLMQMKMIMMVMAFPEGPIGSKYL